MVGLHNDYGLVTGMYMYHTLSIKGAERVRRIRV